MGFVTRSWFRAGKQAALAFAMSLSVTGCLRKVLTDGTIGGTRKAADAVDTLQDFEVAKATARSGLGTLEALYRLMPNNTDDLYLLAKAWSGTTTAFTEDEYEVAEEAKDDADIAYHRARMVAGFKRAKFYATLLLEKKASGFEKARRNADTMDAWMREKFTDEDDADDLAVIANAFIGLVGAGSDDPEIVSGLYIGVAIAERAAELDGTVQHGLPHILLGAYHARFAYAELDDSKKHFDTAVKISEGKYLLAKFFLASRYYCMKSDRAGYERTLNEVLAAGDPMPQARLANLIAKRRARRYLDNDIFQEDCSFGV